MIAVFLRLTLAVALFAILVFVVAWRRGRPDICPFWLAVASVNLLGSIGTTAIVSATGHAGGLLVLLALADVAAVMIAVVLWTSRRWLLHPLGSAEAAREARRLAGVALEVAAVAERAHEEARRGGR
jgi:hypothetical protein